MADKQWLNSETNARGALRQGVDLCLKGLRRPWLTAAVSWGLALSLVGILLVMKRDYAPEYALRVVEADRDPSHMPRLKRQLADYVRQAVLTSAPLLDLMQRHGLYASLVRKNKRAALESFREDISIEVYQNYFVEERSSGGPPRSARLTVSYRSKDPVVALAVTRDLGRMVVEREQQARRDQARASARAAERERATWQAALQRRTGEILSKRAELEHSAELEADGQVQLIGMIGSLGALERQLASADRRAATLELGAELEQRGMGLYFDVVDEGALPSRAGRYRALGLVFAASCLVGTPLVAMAIGAFAAKRGEA